MDTLNKTQCSTASLPDYFAFISYSSKNEKWAKWIQKSLENYRLPTGMRKQYPDLPAKLFPIFRDNTDLHSPVLEEALKKSLASSKYLIVICTPDSAVSHWVNFEIEYFCSLGRQNMIIPLIIDGTAFSDDPEKECFPHSLRNVSPMLAGVNAKELGKHEALIRVVSTMLGINPHELSKRDKKRRNIKRFAAGIALAMLIGITGFFSYSVWEYNVPHVKYYRSYINRFEIPEGVDELSESERALSNGHYRITSQHHRIIKLEHVNSFGIVSLPEIVTSVTQDYPVLKYKYYENGTLSEIAQCDQFGITVSKKILNHNDGNRITVDFTYDDSPLSKTISADIAEYQNNYNNSGINSRIIRQINTYDQTNGLLKKSMYYSDTLGTPACDSNGVYGKSYEYDENERAVSVSNLDQNGNLYNNKYGWATFIYSYENGLMTETVLNANGDITRHNDGYCISEFLFDEKTGNPISLTRKNADGTLCTDNYGIAVYEYVSNPENGLVESRKYYDSEYRCAYPAKVMYEYDQSGRCISSQTFDADGHPVNTGENNCARTDFVLDLDGRTTQWRFYGTDGEPCYDVQSGAHMISVEYDTHGNKISESYFDENGILICSKYGYAAIKIYNNDIGKIQRIEYLDENGQLTYGAHNFAVQTYDYDIYGNLKSVRFYDSQQKPCCNFQGVAGWDNTYLDGRLISQKYVDTDGKPALLKGGFYHEVRYEYDSKGNILREMTYDTEGQLFERTDTAYAVVENAVFDEYANVLEQNFYDRNMNLSCTTDSYYSVRFTYDTHGNIKTEKRTSFPSSSQPETFISYQYDDRGNSIHTLYYDKDPAEATHYAEIKREYDDSDRLISQVTHVPDSYTKKQLYKYDDRGNAIWESTSLKYAGDESETITQICCEYDAFGNMTRKEHRDRNGNLRFDPNDVFAVIVRQYSPQGYVVSDEVYDQNGEAMLYNGQAFRYEYEYDPMGNNTMMAKYGKDRLPLKEADGIAAYTMFEYDNYGYLCEKTFLNERKEPYGAYDKNTVSRMKYVNDTQGYQSQKICYNAAAEVLLHEKANPYIASVYDGSAAQTLGIKAGDAIIQYGDWNLFDEGMSVYDLSVEYYKGRNAPKTLVLCRLSDNGWEFIRAEAPAGTVGFTLEIGMGDNALITQVEELYRIWLEQ